MNLLITNAYARRSIKCFDDKVFHFGKQLLEFFLYRVVINKDIGHTISVRNALNEVFQKENIPVKVFRKDGRLYLKNDKGNVQEINDRIEVDYFGGIHGFSWRSQ